MVGAEPPRDTGVRKRHSGDGDDETSTPRDGVPTGSRPVSLDHTRPSEERPRSVRFSEETERRAGSKKRKSDKITEDGDVNRQSGLSLDTGAAQAAQSNNIIEEGTTKSPSNATPASPQLELGSPRSRSRGRSMRSSLFMRNMSQRGQSEIEMHEMGPSASNGEGYSMPETAKKNPRRSVTNSPVTGKPGDAMPASQSALPNYQQWLAKHTRRHFPLKRLQESYTKVQKFVLRIQEIPPSKDGRHLPYVPGRKVPLVDERTGKPYSSNLIRSSKYNSWNFFPRQLFAQFSKFANFYFLCISILQLIPGLSTTGTYTTIVPLIFFVGLSMAKEGYEDLRRHRLDKAENFSEAKVMQLIKPMADNEGDTDGSVHWNTVKWQEVQVGDVVKLERDDAAPADLILLGSKGPNNTAYIETMALDGETNLKHKQPNPDTIEAAGSAESLASAEMHFVAEDPNLDLYNFEGRVTTNGKTSPLTNNEIIYRGSILRNTPEAYGIVIYSGEECKIRMNANKNPRIKSPALQAMVNRIVLAIALFVVLLSLGCCIGYQVWQKNIEEKSWYIETAPVSFGPLFTSFVIMYNTLIPLSLYVALEIIKIAQMILLNSDADMYDPVSNTPFEARTSTINEELGQVGYIFSDKTGTLTENIMRFRKLSVAGTAWLHDTDMALNGNSVQLKTKGSQDKLTERAPGKSQTDLASAAPRRSTSQWRSSAAPAFAQNEQNTHELIRYLQRWPDTAFSRSAKMMILSMAVCHTCLPERIGDDSGNDENIKFQASSPDELALVEAAKELGYLAYERNASTLTLKTFPAGPGSEPLFEKYEILDVIEFSSKRKRMSVVVRLPDGRVCVFCKGADSVIMARLRLAHVAQQKLAEIDRRTSQRRSMEAHEALRRMSSVVERPGDVNSIPRTSNSLTRRSLNASRHSIGHLDGARDDGEDWLSRRENDVNSPRASSHFSGTPPPQSDTGELVFVDEKIAANAPLVIERCLQHINDFATEGLRTLMYGHRFLDDNEYQTWKKIYHDASTSLLNRQTMIDKAGELIEQRLELGGATAIEDKLQKGVPETIDRLRRANIKMWMLTGDKRETAINIGQSCRLIKDYSSVTVLDYEVGGVEKTIAALIIDINRGGIAHSVVVIDGQTLATIQSDEVLHTLFLDLALLVDSIICCRASPSQKASLVHAIRIRIKGSVTLAIGDGANDIAMIQEAQVGIGITGKEGLQAARTSDYSIAQFRFLTKLLLVQGRWNYIRTCKYCVGTFFKEMLFYLTQAFFQRYNGWSGTSLHESWSLSMFNTLFTSLTIIFIGIFEQDLRASTLIAVPELYTKGQRCEGFNLKVYLGWMFTATADSAIIFFTAWGLFGDAIFSSDNTIYPLSVLTFTACVIIISVKLQIIEQRFKSIMAAISIGLMVGIWILWNIGMSASYTGNYIYHVKGGLLDRWGRSGLWWLTLVIAIISCLLLEIGFRAGKAAFWPTDVEIFQTLESDPATRKRFEEVAAPWLAAGRGLDVQEVERKSLEGQRAAEERQHDREDDVQELLARPRTMEEGRVGRETEEEIVLVGRQRTDISMMLADRFGLPRK